jgi:copper transport protein
MTSRITRAIFHALAAAAAILLLVAPATVVAHAALDEATPSDGATVLGTPAEIAGTFTQDLEPDGSSMQLRDAQGSVIATGMADPDEVRRMAITEVPDLAIGTYEVRWTTLSAEDDELERGTWTFTVALAAKTPGTPAPTETASPSAAATASASAAPTPSASAAPTPSASAAPTDPSGAAGNDVILPIIAALAIVLIGAGVLLSRRSRPAGGA